MTIKFNKNFKTINLITNSNKLTTPIKIISSGIIINKVDLEFIDKIFINNLVKYKIVTNQTRIDFDNINVTNNKYDYTRLDRMWILREQSKRINNRISR